MAHEELEMRDFDKPEELDDPEELIQRGIPGGIERGNIQETDVDIEQRSPDQEDIELRLRQLIPNVSHKFIK
jgi:hypothetical protein